MEALLAALPSIVELTSQLLGALVIVATVIAKLTKTPKDDEVVGKVRGYTLKTLRYLPTLGINPQTKSLEEAIEVAGTKMAK